MQFTSNGKMMFNDIYEMNYHLFTEIGLSVNSQGYLYDQDTGNVLSYKEKYIKATVHPVEIYAGKNDVLFEPYKNYNMAIVLMGYFIDKEAHTTNQIGYVAQYVDPNATRDKQRVVVKTAKGDIYSQYYSNIYLGYIECIFKLADAFDVDLSNFDIVY